MQYLKPGFAILVFSGLSACSNTPSTPVTVKYPEANAAQYAALQMSDGELLKPQWQALKRFEPRYPIEEAIKGNHGCATVEYVITPDYQIKDLRVVTATSTYFAKESMTQVKRWRWLELPAGILPAPVKTTSRFEYCLSGKEGPDNECDRGRMSQNTECSGADVQTSIGYRIIHKRAM